MKKARLNYQSVLRFFGRTHDIADSSLEYTYALIKHLGLSFTDAYNIPVWKRKWFIDKLVNENKQQEEKRRMQEASMQQKNSNNSSRRLFGN